MKYFLGSIFLFSFNVNAVLFEGCGEYSFKGIMKMDAESKKMTYVVFQNTISQKVFEFADREDMVKLAPFLNIQTEFQAQILKEMDGTKGVLKNIKKIGRVFPDPLSGSDMELKKIKSLKCL